MKRTAVVAAALLLGMAALPAAAQKQRYSSSGQVEIDYPLLAHVTRTWLASAPGATDDAPGTTSLHLEAVIDGQKYELRASASGLLHVGDYRAREIRGNESKAGWFSRSYELRFEDGTHVLFKVVGESN